MKVGESERAGVREREREGERKREKEREREKGRERVRELALKIYKVRIQQSNNQSKNTTK